MKDRAKWSVFWALVGIFVLVALLVLIPTVRNLLKMDILLLATGASLLVLGTTLIVYTVKDRTGGLLRAFLILTGASAAGITVSVLLHNAVYGIFIHWFGSDFWDRIGLTDEPFFFFLGLVVCPVAFIIGCIGSIVITLRHERASAGTK